MSEMAWDTENAWRPDWHGRWRSHKPGQALVEQNVARPLLRVRNTGTTERLHSANSRAADAQQYFHQFHQFPMHVFIDGVERIEPVQGKEGNWSLILKRMCC